MQVNAIGKPSLSHFTLLERRGGHSYCEVRIETGRTHQIRVHAQHLGHPVAGDDKYGEADVNKRLRDQLGLKRLFLHAASLEFALDAGQTPYVLSAPLAPNWPKRWTSLAADAAIVAASACWLSYGGGRDIAAALPDAGAAGACPPDGLARRAAA